MNFIFNFLSTHLILIIVLLFFFITLLIFKIIGIKRIADLVTKNPVISICISIFIIGILGIGIKNLVIDADIKSLLPKEVPCREATIKMEKLFGSVDTVFMSIEAKNGTIWQPEILKKVKNISDELKNAYFVDKVISLSEAKDIVNEDDMMVIKNFMDEVPGTQQDVDGIREKVKRNAILGDKIVSKDDTVTIIVVMLKLFRTVEVNGNFEDVKIKDSEICAYNPKNLSHPSLENLKARYEDEKANISISGYAYIRHDTFSKMVADMNLFFPFSIIVMLGFLFLCFRSVRGMLLPFSVVVLSMIGLYGFIGWMREKLYLPYVIIGPMFVAIAHNYGTQLIANYYEDVQAMHGKVEKRQIAESGILKMGTPILLSVATVFIGFITMIGHPLPVMAYLGFFSAFGVVISFILTIILTPAILSLLNVPRMLIEKKHGAFTDKVLIAFSKIIIKFRFLILAIVSVILIIFIALIPFLNIDTNIMGFYKKDSPLNKTFRLLGDKFAGAATLNIMLESTNPVSADSIEDGIMKTPAVMKWMEKFQKNAKLIHDSATGKKLVGDAYSISDQIAYMNKIMQNDSNMNYVPDDRNLIAQYLLLYEMGGGGGDFADLVDPKYNNSQIVIQMPDMSSKSVSKVVKNLNDYIAKNPLDGVKISFGGTLMYTEYINPMLLEGQIVSLVLSVFIILLCYMFVFRSFTAGLLSAIPLVIAIIGVFGLMSIFRINLDYVTTILTSIMIGAGTDYTAYFLWRMREMTRKYKDVKRAYMETMQTIGKGIIFNGFSVVIGFVVFFWSNFVPVIFFGFLIAISIFICIIGALSVLPIVILIIKPKFLER